MQYVLGSLVLTFLVTLTALAVTGRLVLRSCCTIADPSRDLRMRAAFDDEPHHTGDGLPEPRLGTSDVAGRPVGGSTPTRTGKDLD